MRTARRPPQPPHTHAPTHSLRPSPLATSGRRRARRRDRGAGRAEGAAAGGARAGGRQEEEGEEVGANLFRDLGAISSAPSSASSKKDARTECSREPMVHSLAKLVLLAGASSGHAYVVSPVVSPCLARRASPVRVSLSVDPFADPGAPPCRPARKANTLQPCALREIASLTPSAARARPPRRSIQRRRRRSRRGAARGRAAALGRARDRRRHLPRDDGAADRVGRVGGARAGEARNPAQHARQPVRHPPAEGGDLRDAVGDAADREQ